MRYVYVAVLAFGWGYIAMAFHWSKLAGPVALLMTLAFAYYASRVVEDDRQ